MTLTIHDDGLVRAALWEPRGAGPAVRCFLCAHLCTIEPGERGLCGVRENRDGVLYALTFGCAISSAVDPIEKKPLFHFLPGTLSFSIATVGCNLTCAFCQNADISQLPREAGRIRGSDFAPEEVVTRALEAGCRTIAYTYTEPTVFLEYALACAAPAAAAGLKNVFVTNGFMTRQSFELAAPHLHAANVDLKAFDDDFYRRHAGARLKPVLDTITRMVAAGVWVEVTTLVIHGLNDGEPELRALAGFLAGLNPDIPWHVSRFHPAYRMLDRPATPVATIERAVEIGRDEGLRYVYAGNLPGHESESTHCPSCHEVVLERRGFRVTGRRLNGNTCSACGAEIAGWWAS
ncbi:MAG: AmmeMemoRadiSam system radical SAM enzyme [Thermoleophilia bacterium]